MKLNENQLKGLKFRTKLNEKAIRDLKLNII